MTGYNPGSEVDDTWEDKIPRNTEEERRLADNVQHLVMMCGYKEPMEAGEKIPFLFWEHNYGFIMFYPNISPNEIAINWGLPIFHCWTKWYSFLTTFPSRFESPSIYRKSVGQK